MGFLDDVVGKVASAAGGSGTGQSGLVDAVLGLLGGGGQGGGLEGLVRTFQGKGLGDIVSSWVGTGQNLPIGADQLKEGLGADLIGRLASKAGMPAEAATSSLAALLPTLVDKLTPDGSIPDAGRLKEGLEALRNSLSKG